MSDLVRVSMALDAPLLERLEKMVAESGYTNRSEFVRDMIRQRLVDREWSAGQEVVATITMVYDHHTRELNRRLTALQHDHEGQVLATTHVHLDHHHCVEVIIARGRADELQHLADEIRRQRGVLHAALTMSTTGGQLG